MSPEINARITALREKRKQERILRKKLAAEASRREAEQLRKDRLKTFKPCPFCGATECGPQDFGEGCVFVQCDACGATGTVGETKSDAIEKWNKRL